MSLSVGARLGPYEILALLGVSRMGEVYRAKDTRLDRTVAVKVLPHHLSATDDAQQRPQSETRTILQLSHPHICALYDVGEHEGTPYLVMEYLDGETLRAVVRESSLPPRTAIEYGVEIAEGLAAAHAKGIVHLNLKPENLFITRDRHLKILDLGLARQTAIPFTVDRTSPIEGKATSPGDVFDTVGYLSPEQVCGLPADPRSDIFAFGCILHEMLSGKQAFRRQTVAETMSAVLREDPPALAGPPKLAAIVNRCLEKRPEIRFQSAQGLAYALGSVRSASSTASAGLPARRPGRTWLLVAAGAAVLVAIAAGFIWL